VGEADHARNRHAAYYLALAETAETKLMESQQMTWLNQLERQHDNLRAAFRWLLDQRNSASALRLCGGMGVFWEVRGYWSEAGQWIDQVLTLSREVGLSGNSASAVRRWFAQALWMAGHAAWRQWDLAKAHEVLEQSLTLYRELDNREGIGLVLSTMGAIAFEQGEYVTARAFHEESLAVRRAVGNPQRISNALFNLGLAIFHQGDYVAAQTLLEESLKLARETGNKVDISYTLNTLGNVANMQGDYVAAQTLYEECLILRRDLGDKRGIAATLADLANVWVKLAQYRTARALYEESLTLYRELGNKRGLVSVLSGLACLAQAQGQLLMATRLLSAVEALLAQLRTRLDEPQYSDMEQTIATMHAQLDHTTFAAAWAAGRAMTLEQAITEALNR
jgi:tetratricopeptide (TPR) repeat protein